MKASINLEKLKENIVIALPNTRTQRAIRLKKQQSVNLSNNVKKETPKQTSLFDFVETVNTPSKEEFSEILIKSTAETSGDLSDFNQKLKTVLNYNPKNKE